MASLKEKKKKIFAFYTKFTEAVCFSSEKKEVFQSLLFLYYCCLLLLLLLLMMSPCQVTLGDLRRREYF